MKTTVLIDLDGVLHSYVSGWQGATELPDRPVPGAIEFLRKLIQHEEIEPVIYTSRIRTGASQMDLKAVAAIKAWLYLQGLTREEVDQLDMTYEKIPAVLQIDDRGFQFRGKFPSIEYIQNFHPWSVEQEDEGPGAEDGPEFEGWPERSSPTEPESA